MIDVCITVVEWPILSTATTAHCPHPSNREPSAIREQAPKQT